MNYADWIRKAVTFMERARTLSDNIKCEMHVEPPLSDQAARQLANTLPRGIPDPMYRFLTEASANCHCDLFWELPDEYATIYSDFAGYRASRFDAGAKLCNSHEF